MLSSEGKTLGNSRTQGKCGLFMKILGNRMGPKDQWRSALGPRTETRVNQEARGKLGSWEPGKAGEIAKAPAGL